MSLWLRLVAFLTGRGQFTPGRPSPKGMRMTTGDDRRNVSSISDSEIMEIARLSLGLGVALEEVGDSKYQMRMREGTFRSSPVLELKDEHIVAFVRQEQSPSLTGRHAVREALSLLTMYIDEDLSAKDPPGRSGLRSTDSGTFWFCE